MALFIAGIAVGLFLYRTYVEFVRNTTQLTRCDICKYANDCEQRMAQKKTAKRGQGD